MRLISWLIKIILVVLVVAGLSLFFLPSGRIAKIAVDQISAQTGREVTISGDAQISVYPVLGVSTGAMTIANADWSDAGPMMQADSLKVGVDLMALIRGDIRITGMEAIAPKILLERASDGRVNWELGVDGVAPSGQASGTSNALALSLDRALISNGSLRYVDHETGAETKIDGVDLDLKWPDYRGAADFDLVLRPAGADVRITGRVAEFANLIASGISPVTARIDTKGGVISFDGRAGIAPEAAGKLTVSLSSTSAFLASLGMGSVELPRGFGQAISLSADTTLTADQRLSFRETVLSLDQNTLSGAADITLSGKPRINAKFAAGALDLSGLTGGDSSGGSSSASSGWSKTAIDASALGLMDGEMAITASSVDLGGIKFGQTRALVTIDNSRAVFELRELQGYSGMTTGQVVVNNRNGLSVGGTMSATNVEVQQLLSDAMGITRVSGQANVELSFLGAGGSIHAIMNSLSGKGAANLGRGTISGFDLDRLMRSGDVGGGTTVFDSLTASWVIEGGNLQNDNLLMTLPQITATGKGRVGLGAQDIDYLFTPTAAQARGGKGLVIPVRIRGPWSNPSIIPDLKAAIDLNLADEKKKVEEQVKAKVADKIQKELGVTVQEGQKPEDALKEKLQDEAAKGLLKLLKK